MALFDSESNTSVFLATNVIEKYNTTKAVVHELYLNKLLIHPDQINKIILTKKPGENNEIIMLIEIIIEYC